MISLLAALSFYRDVLEMECELQAEESVGDCLEVQTGFQGPVLVLVQGSSEKSAQPVLLFTADCLRDYNRLKKRGVVFSDKPWYIEAGLAVGFSDPYGNSFMLLERRNYQFKILL